MVIPTYNEVDSIRARVQHHGQEAEVDQRAGQPDDQERQVGPSSFQAITTSRFTTSPVQPTNANLSSNIQFWL